MAILIIGLGNPGKQYTNTRHNLGFLVLDALAQALQEKWKVDRTAKAEVIETRYFDKKLILAKPQTFMNLSGQSVATLSKKFKVAPEYIWIISDDAALPLGTVRSRKDGSAGGHNGLKSVIEKLGTESFVRFRLGVDGPPSSVPLDAYVLQPFPKSKFKALAKIILKTRELILRSVAEGVSETSLNVPL